MSTVTTVGDLADRVHRTVNGSRRQTTNYLDAATLAADPTITLADDLGGITSGSYLGIDEEILYVRSVVEATRVATVRRGMFNTTAANHADDAEVQVDWRWFTADVVDALADEIRGWGPEVFAVGEVDVTVGSSSTAIALTLTRFRHPLLLQRSTTGVDRWIDVSGEYRVLDDTPDGAVLQFPSNYRGSGTVRLHYAQDFAVDAVTAATTVATLGIPNTLHDAAIYGASARLLIGDEGPRSSTRSQPEPRIATEVRAGQAIQTGAAYRQLADERVAQEAARLRSKFPYRRF